MRDINNLRDLLVYELKELYSTEKQLLEAIPKMISASTSTELRDALSEHLEETREHKNIVARLLQSLHENPGNLVCDATRGLVKEGESILSCNAPPPVRDAALIAVAQQIEHFEMAGYGTVRAYARALGEDSMVEELGEILEQESRANSTLNAIAMRGGINEQAMAA